MNEAAHLAEAKGLRIPVAAYSVVTDRSGLPGLLVERLDRIQDGKDGGVPLRLPLEDAAQVLNLPPASKYGKVSGLRARHWQEFAAAIGLPPRAAAAIAVALRAAEAIDLEALPFTGTPLNGPCASCGSAVPK